MLQNLKSFYNRQAAIAPYFYRLLNILQAGHLPLFFAGEITYQGEFPREIMALLELGRLIHVGKIVTFGNRMFEIEV